MVLTIRALALLAFMLAACQSAVLPQDKKGLATLEIPYEREDGRPFIPYKPSFLQGNILQKFPPGRPTKPVELTVAPKRFGGAPPVPETPNDRRGNPVGTVGGKMPVSHPKHNIARILRYYGYKNHATDLWLSLKGVVNQNLGSIFCSIVYFSPQLYHLRAYHNRMPSSKRGKKWLWAI
jgi:hypothetical protein